MRTTGKTQGILFLDEINCVSETLSPAMLLFLQYKVFGGHQIPEGWVVVTAGNPPRFNKSVREFDAATRDRLKVIEVEPSYEAWKAYALEHGVSRSVISYLDIRPEDFYKVETTVDGLTVVTPRAWEDLSEILQYHEELGLAVSEELTTQYLQTSRSPGILPSTTNSIRNIVRPTILMPSCRVCGMRMSSRRHAAPRWTSG